MMSDAYIVTGQMNLLLANVVKFDRVKTGTGARPHGKPMILNLPVADKCGRYPFAVDSNKVNIITDRALNGVGNIDRCASRECGEAATSEATQHNRLTVQQ